MNTTTPLMEDTGIDINDPYLREYIDECRSTTEHELRVPCRHGHTLVEDEAREYLNTGKCPECRRLRQSIHRHKLDPQLRWRSETYRVKCEQYANEQAIDEYKRNHHGRCTLMGHLLTDDNLHITYENGKPHIKCRECYRLNRLSRNHYKNPGIEYKSPEDRKAVEQYRWALEHRDDILGYCIHGHMLTKDTLITSGKKKQCKECHRLQMLMYFHRKHPEYEWEDEKDRQKVRQYERENKRIRERMLNERIK